MSDNQKKPGTFMDALKMYMAHPLFRKIMKPTRDFYAALIRDIRKEKEGDTDVS